MEKLRLLVSARAGRLPDIGKEGRLQVYVPMEMFFLFEAINGFGCCYWYCCNNRGYIHCRYERHTTIISFEGQLHILVLISIVVVWLGVVHTHKLPEGDIAVYIFMFLIVMY
jgi:hypothetical protein